jgi:hypothetical protein
MSDIGLANRETEIVSVSIETPKKLSRHLCHLAKRISALSNALPRVSFGVFPFVQF